MKHTDNPEPMNNLKTLIGTALKPMNQTSIMDDILAIGKSVQAIKSAPIMSVDDELARLRTMNRDLQVFTKDFNRILAERDDLKAKLRLELANRPFEEASAADFEDALGPHPHGEGHTGSWISRAKTIREQRDKFHAALTEILRNTDCKYASDVAANALNP